MTLWSGADRFGERERDALRVTASCLTTVALSTLVWRLVPGEYLGIAWLALALVILEAGLRSLPESSVPSPVSSRCWAPRACRLRLSSSLALISAALAYAFACVHAMKPRPGARYRHLARHALPVGRTTRRCCRLAVSPAWALVALVFAEFDRRSLRVPAIS